MPQRKMRKLVTATIAAGLIGGLAFGSPLAFADPEPAPDPFGPPPGPGRRARAEAPIDPAAAIVPPPAPPSGPPSRATGRSAGRAARRPRPSTRSRRRSTRSRRRRRAPTRSPHGRRRFPRARPRARTRRRTPVSRCSLPPSFNPVNGSMVGVAKPIIINFAAADRRPRDGRAGDPHLVDPAGAGQVLLDERHPGALAPARLLAGQHHRQHRRGRRQVDLPHR